MEHYERILKARFWMDSDRTRTIPGRYGAIPGRPQDVSATIPKEFRGRFRDDFGTILTGVHEDIGMYVGRFSDDFL
eukprot:2309543-Pyramimonas_sp.AAC.1